MIRYLLTVLGFPLLLCSPGLGQAGPDSNTSPRFSRHVAAVFSRLGCNGGTCHGAVKGQNGFRLSLFGADPALDHELLREFGGRRLNLIDPDASLLLLKATGQVATRAASGWTRQPRVRDPAPLDRRRGRASIRSSRSRVTRAARHPAEQTVKPGESYRLRVEAKFADGSTEDVTPLCSYESLDRRWPR